VVLEPLRGGLSSERFVYFDQIILAEEIIRKFLGNGRPPKQTDFEKPNGKQLGNDGYAAMLAEFLKRQELGLSHSFTTKDNPTPLASDLDAPPGRVSTTVYRILRDTELARRIKRIHEYKCQICGETIQLLNGSRYAEAHHI
jgi:hypothetical protein